jgi:hypothetical protein
MYELPLHLCSEGVFLGKPLQFGRCNGSISIGQMTVGFWCYAAILVIARNFYTETFMCCALKGSQ